MTVAQVAPPALLAVVWPHQRIDASHWHLGQRAPLALPLATLICAVPFVRLDGQTAFVLLPGHLEL